MKPSISGHPESRTCLEKRTKCLVPNVTVFVKLPPNTGNLFIADKVLRPAGARYSEVSVYLPLCRAKYRLHDLVYET